MYLQVIPKFIALLERNRRWLVTDNENIHSPPVVSTLLDCNYLCSSVLNVFTIPSINAESQNISILQRS